MKQLSQEYPPSHEAVEIEKLTTLLTHSLAEKYGSDNILRDAHPKQHGCVRGTFTVQPNLPDNLSVGLFKTANSYPVWVRFSNANSTVSPDGAKDMRGMAIKLMQVPGEKLLTDETHTQDFLLISHDVFPVATVADFRQLVAAMVSGQWWQFALFFLRKFWVRWRTVKIGLQANQQHASLLGLRYWSMTPYLFGQGRAVKYSVMPSHPTPQAIPQNPADTYLSDGMQQHLQQHEATFDFMVQFQTNANRMPIEDPSIRWLEEQSPFHKVATLHLPPQTFDSEAQMEFGQNLSFSPWHSLPEHRPLGGINRARKVAYEVISEFRHQRNNVPRVEPTGEEQF